MSTAKASHFRTVQKFTSDFSPNDFVLYESERTGMRIVVVDQKGPKVYGYFALATEIHDDSGAPHTLEHLVFMGSRSYKYKGLLDKLATRAYSGTNAWTATDQTVYTLDTAGWDGFAQILPVYLEHVLLPTLTDAGCLTEVHHIDGKGHDAGVVYSEMQGVQNEMDSLLDLQARRLLYPKSNAFRSETGGLMEQLRVLTADRIRDFHREMYQPKNLAVILIGEVDQPNLLDILEKFEDSIKDQVPRLDEPFDRPWMKHGRTPALTKSTIDKVDFPEEDESMGQIMIGFLGPDFNDDLLSDALAVTLVYICGSSISLLENTIVEKEQLASAVYYSTDARPDITIWFTLSGVETEKLESTEKRFFEVLREAADKPLDMAYLKDCLHRYKRQLKSIAEGSGNFFGDGIIADHCYGKRDGSTLRDIATLKEFNVLEQWSESKWRDYFKKYIAHAHHVSVLGVPSAKLSKKMKAEEEARVKAQQEKLGPEGLEKMAKKLDAAKAENDKEIPKEVIQQFKIPGTESIHFIPTITARSGLARRMGDLENEAQRVIDGDKTDLPIFMHFEHIPSNFVVISMYLCTHQIPVELRPLITLYLANFFDTPVKRGGVRVDFEGVVTQLEKDTVSYDIDAGDDVSNPELLRIRFSVEPGKYETAIEWIRDLLLHNLFDETRLIATLAKILADIPEEKRSGSSMVSAVSSLVHYSRESTARAQNTLVKSVCLKRALAMLKNDPQALITKLESIRTHLAQPANLRILILTNLLSNTLPTPVSSWKILTSALPPPSPNKPDLQPLDSPRSTLSHAGANPGSIAYIVPLSTIDSSYATLSTKHPTSYSDPDLPALRVALAYLNAVEGPLWVAVRGTGLAYGAGFSANLSTGRLAFRIYRSPDAHNACAVAKKTVSDIASGAVELDEFGLEGAVSSIVVGFADEQPTMGSAAVSSFANQVVKGIEKDWMVGFLKQVRDVTPMQVRAAMVKWVVPCFEAGKADLVCTCAGIMGEKLQGAFEGHGFGVQVRALGSFVDDYGMEGEELVGEEEEDDEEGSGEDESGEESGDEEDDDEDKPSKL